MLRAEDEYQAEKYVAVGYVAFSVSAVTRGTPQGFLYVARRPVDLSIGGKCATRTRFSLCTDGDVSLGGKGCGRARLDCCTDRAGADRGARESDQPREHHKNRDNDDCCCGDDAPVPHGRESGKCRTNGFGRHRRTVAKI